MTSDNATLAVTFFALLITAVSLGLIYYSIMDFNSSLLSGFATYNYSNATINITVAQMTVINFSVNNIDFGSGAVTNFDASVLDSNETGTATGGTWTLPGKWLVLDNIGTVNVSIELMSGKNSTQLLGAPTSVMPQYNWSIINNEPGSCQTPLAFGRWYNSNNTYPGTMICNTSGLGYHTTQNSINISIRLVVPYDSNNGSLGDIISARATSAV